MPEQLIGARRQSLLLGSGGLLVCVAIGWFAATPRKSLPITEVNEIKIGQTIAYTGPASAFGTVGRTEAAYFKKVNDEGGIHGRKINFISVDDAYSPPKTIDQVRKLVEGREVLAIFQAAGTPSNTAIRRYLTDKKVPQLFVSAGATKWNEPTKFPWTIGFNPSYQLEARTYAEHVLKTRPNAKIGVLYQNDELGKDYIKGLNDTLGPKAAMIVKEVTYEITDVTIDSQMISLQASGADVFINFATPRFAAQAIRKAYTSGWKPLQYVCNGSSSIGAVLTLAGLDKSVGIITSAYLKEPTNNQWHDDPAMKEYFAFLAKYYPDASPFDARNVYATVAAQTLVQVLEQCGNDLSRENIMRQAANLRNFAPGLLLPGVTMNTAPDDFAPFDSLRLARFDGNTYELLAQ